MLSWRSAGRRTRGAFAAAVAMGCFALVGGWGAGSAGAVAPPLPTLPIPTPTIPPLPTLPIPTPTLLPTPSLPTLPIPTLPLPTPGVSNLVPSMPGGPPGLPGTAVPGLLPGAGQPGQAGGTSGLPGGAAGTSSGGTGSVGPSAVETSVLGSLLGLLGTPAGVGVERPSLEHFDTTTGLRNDRIATGQPGGGRAGGPGGPLVGALGAVLLVLVLAGLLRRYRARLSRPRAVLAVPLAVVALALLATAVQLTLFPAPARTGSPVALVATDTASHPGAAALPAGSTGATLFSRVVGFETQIGAVGAALQVPTGGAGAAQLRQEHALALSLETILLQEYDFFAATARDPGQSAALLQVAASQPAAVRNAVTYDVDAIQAQLAQQAAIAQAAAANPVAGVAPPAVVATGTPAVSPGALQWPLGGVVTQRFGPSPFAIEPAVTLAGISYPHFHTGVDIAAPYETPVVSAADGVVALAGSETDGAGHLVGYGNYVVIAHGGNMITLYGHLAEVLVRAGEAVRAGQPIGLEGSTGNSTGPHVHFELRVQGRPTDPMSYVASR